MIILLDIQHLALKVDRKFLRFEASSLVGIQVGHVINERHPRDHKEDVRLSQVTAHHVESPQRQLHRGLDIAFHQGFLH